MYVMYRLLRKSSILKLLSLSESKVLMQEFLSDKVFEVSKVSKMLL